MKLRNCLFLTLAVCLGLLTATAACAKDGKVPRIGKEQVKAMLSDPDVVIIDVRIDRDWSASHAKIKGALREDHKTVKIWADKLDKKKTYVLYCA
jgi:predicted sulfurtransferase